MSLPEWEAEVLLGAWASAYWKKGNSRHLPVTLLHMPDWQLQVSLHSIPKVPKGQSEGERIPIVKHGLPSLPPLAVGMTLGLEAVSWTSTDK